MGGMAYGELFFETHVSSGGIEVAGYDLGWTY